MKGNLSDLVIMSDVDGTLLHWAKNGGKTPARNIEALERFTSKGGRFAIATGRALLTARPVAEVLPVNFPCVILNGGAVYDFQSNEYLHKLYLPDGAQRYVKEILKAFPQCGGVFVDENYYYDVDGVTRNEYLRLYPNNLLMPVGFDELKGPFLKALIVLPPERMKPVYEYVSQASFNGVRFVLSDRHMLEMLPDGSSKGDALERITRLTGVKRENMVAIGDFYNDIEMIEYAGLGVTMSDAPEDIRNIAQMIVCPCADGALADLVERLESRCD